MFSFDEMNDAPSMGGEEKESEEGGKLSEGAQARVEGLLNQIKDICAKEGADPEEVLDNLMGEDEEGADDSEEPGTESEASGEEGSTESSEDKARKKSVIIMALKKRQGA